MLFRKTWNTNDITDIVYEYQSIEKDVRVKLTLTFYSKDACNKKNPVPRPKVHFMRCYDLKDGFDSESNFYEVDKETFDLVLDVLNDLNSRSRTVNKPRKYSKKENYNLIKIKRKFAVLCLIYEGDELFDKLKELLISLIQ